MSESETESPNPNPNPEPSWKSAEQWQSLEAEEREAVFEQRRQQNREAASAGGFGAGSGSGSGSDGGFEFTEIEPQEAQSALERIKAKTQETWQAVVLEDVVLEMFELQERHITLLKRLGGLFASIQAAESVDELDEEALEQLQEADERLEELLEELTVEEEMDAEWWAAGQYPGSLKLEVFSALFDRYNEQEEESDNFR